MQKAVQCGRSWHRVLASCVRLQEILARDEESARRTLSALRRRNVDPAYAQALVLFGEKSSPGSSADLTMALDGLLVVAAPAPPMDAETQNTATALELRVTRSKIERTYEDLLPEPMADPVQDLRIRAARASAYFVRAGEFIQVIDVSGRQCTDFQAFRPARSIRDWIWHSMRR